MISWYCISSMFWPIRENRREAAARDFWNLSFGLSFLAVILSLLIGSVTLWLRLPIEFLKVHFHQSMSQTSSSSPILGTSCMIYRGTWCVMSRDFMQLHPLLIQERIIWWRSTRGKIKNHHHDSLQLRLPKSNQNWTQWMPNTQTQWMPNTQARLNTATSHVAEKSELSWSI